MKFGALAALVLNASGAVAAKGNQDTGSDSSACPAAPLDVSVRSGAFPEIDGDGTESAWSSATKIPMFKASKSTKEILGYGKNRRQF